MGNATLGACILINQRERNVAIGIANDSAFLRGVIYFIHSATQDQLKSDISLLAKAAYLKAMIEELTTLADRLVDHITTNIEDDDIRRDGLEAMSKLEAYTNHLGNELEAIL